MGCDGRGIGWGLVQIEKACKVYDLSGGEALEAVAQLILSLLVVPVLPPHDGIAPSCKKHGSVDMFLNGIAPHLLKSSSVTLAA